MKFYGMFLAFITSTSMTYQIMAQVALDTIATISTESFETKVCFNNSKMMAGRNADHRYMVFNNSDTVFLQVLSSGIWSKRVVYTGTKLLSATLTSYMDTIWFCWKEGSAIKARFTRDEGSTWSEVIRVSPAGYAAAPSVWASSNGKIHFVWSASKGSDTVVYHRFYHEGRFSEEPSELSNTGANAYWPSVVAGGDTVLCAWKEGTLPSKVWFARSTNGGISWDSPVFPTASLEASKDPNLAIAYDSATGTHYTYLAYDGKNYIYLQRSMDFGDTWTDPEIVSNPAKLSQFAHLECNNMGFVGISYEHRTIRSILDDTKKDVGFVYSTSWADSGSFGNDSLAYTRNAFGSAYPGFNQIDENNFYLVWLTRDDDGIQILERRVDVHSAAAEGPRLGFDDHSVRIFPNPAKDFIRIEMNARNCRNISLFDTFGTMLRDHLDFEFSVDDLAPGIYFISVQTDSGSLVKKLLRL